MAEIYLHIGTHKTGTTTLQYFLSSNREALAQQGILYPKSGLIEAQVYSGSHKLGWCLLKKRGESELTPWHDLKEEIRTSRLQKVIISTESFSLLSPDSILKVKEFLGGHQVYIIIYFRNYKDYFRSRYAQLIQDVGNQDKKRHDINRPRTISFPKYINENQSVINYDLLLRNWGEVFGYDALLIRCFDKIIQDSTLVRDLSSILRIDKISELDSTDIRKNISLGEQGINAISLLGKIRKTLPFILTEKRYLAYLNSIKRRELGNYKTMKKILFALSRKKFVSGRTSCMIEDIVRRTDRPLLLNYFNEVEVDYLEGKGPQPKVREQGNADSIAKNKKVVYTVIIGDYDDLKEPEIISPGFDYICFTDRDDLHSSTWKIRKVQCRKYSTSKQCAGSFIVYPFDHLKEYELSVLVIGNITIRCDLNDFIGAVLPPGKSIALMRHPERDCIYQAAETVIRLRKDDPEVVRKQMSRYRKEGFPENFGLQASGIMVRRHSDEQLLEHCRLWKKEIDKGSQRDQLSFQYILWKYRLIDPVYFPWEVTGKEFKIQRHNFRQQF